MDIATDEMNCFIQLTTVNSQIFARVSFSRSFAYMRSFVKIKSSRNGEIIRSITGKVNHAVIVSLNAIRENKILAKICGFTVSPN